jgi:hypothetical protein
LPVPPIAIKAFGGEVPAVDDRLISDGNATQSVNAWLLSGRCEPIRSLQPIHVLTNQAARSFFRYPILSTDIDHMDASKWLEFENENVRVIRSPTAGQADDGRFYWCDEIFPKYLTGDMIVAGTPAYKLGVPPPVTAPGVTSSGGVSTTNKTVAYVYTWVTGLGEEGPPSPPTTVVGKIDATYHITMSPPGPVETADRNLTNVRIYRTVVSAQGVSTFFFVDELPIATLTYDDDCSGGSVHGGPDSIIVANEQLQSTNWSPPPFDLKGMVTMPNGMIAGWRGNEVWFCEPYLPHAWPVMYTIAVDPIIVGLGVYNQSLIILCEGQPYAATGVHPSAMALVKVQPLEACTSMRSIVNTPNGVLYSSPNGLINITPQGATNLTINTILKSQWNEMLHLQTLMASVISQAYYCYSGSQAGVFQNSNTPPDAFTAFQQDAFQQESHFGTLPGAYISLVDAQRLGVTVLDPTPNEVINVITDIFNGETMVLRDGVIYLVDTRQKAPYASYRWRSKIFTLPYLENMGAAKVYWTPQDPTTLPAPTYFRVFAGAQADLTDDGLPLRFEQKMTQSGQMFRLPSGFKALYYQFEVEGYNVVDAIHCAQTAHELRNI